MLLFVQSGCQKTEQQKTNPKTTAIMQKTTGRTSAGKSATAPASTAKSKEDVAQPEGNGDDHPDTNTEGSEPEKTIGAPFEGLKFDPDIDLQGKSLVWAEFGPAPVKGKSVLDDIRILTWEKAEKKFNCKIEYKEAGVGAVAVPNLISSVLAGVKFADFYSVSLAFLQLYTTNCIIPVDKYIDFSHSKWESVGQLTLLPDNKHYSFNPDVTKQYQVTYYHKGIFEREGLPDILELSKAKAWNWDSLLEFAKICTKDFNGDGVLDQWGVGDGASTLFNAILYSNNVAIVNIREGQFVCDLYRPEALRAMQFYQQLKFVEKVSNIKSGPGVANDEFYKNTVAMNFGSVFTSMQYLQGGIPIGQAPYPTGPDSRNDTIISTNQVMWNIPLGATLDPGDIITVVLYANYNDPDDPEIYIDPYKSFQEVSMNREGLGGAALNTQDEIDFFFEYQKNLKVRYDFVQSTKLNTIINPKVITPIRNGDPVNSTVTSAQSQIDEFLNNIYK
ncbi:MAG TPA: hypothetical protein DCY35_11510 [Prolixibacteraceae bacterium]|nr:hypothetical protein [Prolixibacteraceae bacterium]